MKTANNTDASVSAKTTLLKTLGVLFNSRKYLNGFIAIIIVLVTATGSLAYNKYLAPHDSLETTQMRISEAIRDESSDKKQVIRQLHTVRRKADTREGKRQASYILASKYAEDGNHAMALKYFKEAIKLADTTDINSILGAAEEAALLGDKSKAKDYYQLAVEYYIKQANTDPSLTKVIDVLNEKISNL